MPRPQRTRSERLQLWCEDALERWAPVFLIAMIVLATSLVLVAVAALAVEAL